MKKLTFVTPETALSKDPAFISCSSTMHKESFRTFCAVLRRGKADAAAMGIKRGTSYFFNMAEFHLASWRVIVEDTMELGKATEEIGKDIKLVLQQLGNEISVTAGIVKPQLSELIKDVRSARQTVFMEMTQSLNMLKDVRKFFIEDDYEKEMGRLKEFVSLCEKLKALKEDGTLDAVVDIAIKLAIGKEETDVRK